MALFNFNKPLVEFRAGKCTTAETNGLIRVTPDKRRGLVQLSQSPDMLIHFTWKDRTTGIIEDDLIIFAEEATLKRVKQVKDNRVLLLEFNGSNRRLFFWLQEPKTDKDDEYVTKINQYINNPPTSEESGGSLGGLPSNRLDQDQMMQMFQQVQRSQRQSPSSTRSPSTARPPSSQQPQSQSFANSDLQNILSGLGMPASALSNVLGQQQQQGTQQNTPNLSQAINPDLIEPLLNNPQVRERLLPYLPEGRRNPEELRQILRSPQLQQSLQVLNSALQSGQLGELLSQFGLPSSSTPSSVEGFLQALQEYANQQRDPQQEKSKDKKDKDDDKMDTN